jgi:hypothetical protein
MNKNLSKAITIQKFRMFACNIFGHEIVFVPE